MHQRMFARASVVGLAWLTLLPATVSAQSTIAGAVRDTTGAVLPGVSVEAASPALIEKVRTVVTDSEGRYAIVNVRPGVYAVTFTLPGFTTVVREGIEVASNVTVPLNIELKVSGLEETVTVSGATPVVDVQRAQRTEVLARDVLNALPTPRNAQSLGSTMPGVKITMPDVGGTRLMENIRMGAHGTTGRHTAFQVDGMGVESHISDMSGQNYHNDAMIQEISIQTSAQPAEVQAGGLRFNIIPKEGGNTFSGEVYLGGTDGKWQSNNLTPELIAKGVRQPSAIAHIQDFNGSVGGPIVRDRLWFVFAARHSSVDEKVLGNLMPDGSQSVIPAHVRHLTGRLTAQVTPKNKVSAYLDRNYKLYNGQVTLPGQDFVTAGVVRDIGRHGLYAIGQAKWTSMISNQLLYEAGYSMNLEQGDSRCKPGIDKPRGTPEWYATTAKQDRILQTTTRSCTGGLNKNEPDMRIFLTSLSYVTGSHNFKVGMSWHWGQDSSAIQGPNGDLIQIYNNGVPEFVNVLNTPLVANQLVNADVRTYAQDSWAIKRLTVNAGIAFEHFNGEIPEQSAPAGRFVPARFFGQVPNMPNWNDVAPRFSAVYDLFGNAKTALKGSAGKYVLPWASGWAKRYNPMVSSSDRRTWRDLNGDDIAQDNEIGPSTNRRFGLRSERNPAPDLEREYHWEYTASVQHELMPRVSVTAGWYRRVFYNVEAQDNLLVDPVTDYDAFQTPNPLTGELITVYNLKPEKFGLVSILDTTSATDGSTYDGFEASMSTRLRNGGLVFGGWSMERMVTVACDTDDPNKWRFCDQRGKLHRELGVVPGIPFRHEFKLAGSYPLPLGVDVSATFMSVPNGTSEVAASRELDSSLRADWVPPPSVFPGGVRYSVPRSIYVDGQRTHLGLVALIPPGTKYKKQWNQLDFSVKKRFRVRRVQLEGQLAYYNLLNSAVVLDENQVYGVALGQPLRILQGRMPRVALLMKW